MKVVRIWEGLGNQMFQYAYAKRLQKHTNETIYLEGRRVYREVLPEEDLKVERRCSLQKFNISLKFIKPSRLKKWGYLEQRTILQKIKYNLAQKQVGKYLFLTDHEDKFSFHKELFECKKSAYVMGHFFHRDYFEPIKDDLIKEFTLKQDLQLSKKLKDILENRNTVSVHIRRGDYLYAKCAQLVNKEMKQGKYYERAMKYVAEQVENPIFLFFSDDIEWVEGNIKCPYEHFYVSRMKYEDYEELVLMSCCKHNIIANSTFSFWGGWLNRNKDKIVIAPKRWMPSVVPKEWIRM